MKIRVKRDKEIVKYQVPKGLTLLQALYKIKEEIDSSLTFDSGCRSMVCGACSVRVNGKEALACGVRVEDNALIEPINYHQVVRDLKVKKDSSAIKRAKAHISGYREATLGVEDELKFSKESDCILCSSCHSACPVFEVNSEFISPFALAKAYRYALDKRNENPKEIIDAIQKNGIWDCTLCGECTTACPKGIDPKGDIMGLRNLSVQYGYSDPNIANMSFNMGLDFL
jgi:fumarate reductase iron-sulfur subunit